MMRSEIVLALVIVVVTSSVTAQVPSTQTKAGMDPERLSRIPVRMKEFVEARTISGAVTLVARHGVVASLHAVGYSDREGKIPMRTDAIVQIRSMTKSVTAVAIMILLEDGRLLLSDPVEKYVPEFQRGTINDSRGSPNTTGSLTPARPITIRDLLTHTAGVGAPPPDSLKEPFAMRTLAELAGLPGGWPRQFEPGARWAYSDAGYLVLGRVIEVVSGYPYEQFVADRILEPLGMADSFFVPPAEKHGRIAGDEAVTLALYPPGAKFSSPAWGMHSTASDVAAFYQMLLNRGLHRGRQVLSSSAADVMTAVQTGSLQAGFLPGTGWGLGLEVVRERVGMLPVGSFGHGTAGGSYAWGHPGGDLVGVILSWGARPGDSGAATVRDVFMAMTEAAVRN
jgi:CubicO group peptidase (beta-lactamase class C family)